LQTAEPSWGDEGTFNLGMNEIRFALSGGNLLASGGFSQAKRAKKVKLTGLKVENPWKTSEELEKGNY